MPRLQQGARRRFLVWTAGPRTTVRVDVLMERESCGLLLEEAGLRDLAGWMR